MRGVRSRSHKCKNLMQLVSLYNRGTAKKILVKLAVLSIIFPEIKSSSFRTRLISFFVLLLIKINSIVSENSMNFQNLLGRDCYRTFTWYFPKLKRSFLHDVTNAVLGKSKIKDPMSFWDIFLVPSWMSKNREKKCVALKIITPLLAWKLDCLDFAAGGL